MTSVMDERIKWLEVRISSSLRPRNEDLKNMLANEENQLAFQEFVTNEDVRRLFVYIHGNKHIIASQQPPANLRSKSIFFLKITPGTKLTKENMDDEIHYIDCSNIPLEHLDLLAREVFLPLVCTNAALSESAGVNADRLMDLLHRLMSTVEVTQGFVEGRIVLSLPSIEVLAEAASSVNRRSSVLHVLETTVISWIKQIKTVLKHEPLLDLYQIFGPEPGPLDEIQIWERQLERLHSINEQLDSPVAKDILSNLEQANSQYAHSFGNVRKDINKAVDETKKVLRFLSTMSGWFESLHQAIRPRHMVRNFKPLMTVLVLVWTHCKYYHEKDKLHNILQLISTEAVHRAMAMVGEDILREPLESYTKLKEALRVCAAFRGTYLDFKDQADSINVKNLAENAESQTRPQGSLFTVKLYGNHSFHPRFNQSRGDSNASHSSVTDEDEWTDSPWPARNAPCFDLLNSFMERCNDVLELVETTRHFRLLAGAAEVGGAGSQSLDALVKEVHAQYSDAMREFFSVVDNVLSVDGSQSFEKAFFKFRTVVKMLERRLAGILRQAFQQCPTIGAQLRLLEVFEGISGRELVQCHLEDKDSLLVQSFTEEIKNVRNMFTRSKANPPSHSNMPPIVSQMMWVYALKERITVPMVKMRNVSPHSLEGENGWQLREAFQDAIREFEQFETYLISEWQSSITYELTTRLKQPLLIAEDYDEEIDLRPQVVQVNLDPMLLLLLREVQYLKRPPFNIKLPEAAKELIRNTDCYEMRVTATRLETIVSKYNMVMKTITDYEKPLFERKLDKVDQLFDQGLHHYTWKMKESADFIESAMSLVCLDVHQNLDIVQTNCHEIAEITISWSKGTLDVFTARTAGKSYSMEELLHMQVNLTEDHENLVVPSGNKIHSLVLNSFEAVQISQASPAWRDYIQYIDAIILDGLKQSSLTSLKSKLNTLVQANMNMIVEQVPILSIRLELIENRVSFRPPLDQMSSIVSVQELVQRWLDDFVARGKLVRMIGSKDSYEDYIRVDDEVQQILAHITKLVQDNSEECKTLYSLFRNYTFLWLQDVNQTFDDFLHGKAPTLHHQGKAAQQTWDPERPQSDQHSRISLLDQLDDGFEDLRFIERSFLTPQHNFESDNGYVPSLDEFDDEIDIYRNARDEISSMPDHQDVGWLRVDLQPIKQVLTTYASKWMWTFTKYLSDQVTATLENLDRFLKRIEPEIESITGEERDTASFMKMMRLFNEVSAQQAEMDGKFSIMNKTVQLLKKYGQQLPEKTQNLFHAAPGRWNNLKTKVSLAKQRLGPRIQEESARITTDLEAFGVRVMELNSALEQSPIYNRDCSIDNAYTAIEVFAKRLTVLENEAQDLIELQELLETSVVNFSILPECRHDLNNLKQVWETVRVIEDQQSSWKKQRWQKMNTQYLREETTKQLEIVKALSEDVFTWDVYMGLLESITTVQMCLPLIDDLSNPAMRTRHWKQLVRVTGGALTIDNDTLKRMTLGELLGLGLQKHVDDVRAIVQRAVKDLTIEQSLKTYEEVWLSKIFELRQHVRIRTDPQLEVAQDNHQEVMQNDPPSQQHISLVSRTQGRATSRVSNQSSHSRNKRGSVASLPQSLLNLGEESGQICLLHNTDPIFEELESHQVALQAMQSNSAAGSFLDEVIKWQKRLQTIEAVLTVWLDVQEKWIEMEEVYLSTEIRISLSHEANIFSQINKDVRLVMRATEKNPNVLQCCSRKNIHSILEHAQHNMELCQQSLLRYLERRRQIFPRFYFLSMEDVLHIICNGYDLNQVNVFISKLFEHVDSLLFEDIDDNDRCRCQIIGVVSALGERLEFREPVLCEGQIESWLTQFLQMLKHSLQFQLATAMGVEKAPPKLITMAGVESRRIKLLSRGISKGVNDKKNGKDKSSSRSSSRQTLGRDRHRHTDAGHGAGGSVDHQAGQDFQAEGLDLEHTAPRSWTIDHVAEIVHLATQIQMTERIQEALTVVDSGQTDALQESLDKIIGSIQATTLMLRGLKYERDLRSKQDDVNDSDVQSATEGRESVLESSSFPMPPVNRGRRASIKTSALDNLVDPQKLHADSAATGAEEPSQAEDSQSQEPHSESPNAAVPKADDSAGGEKSSMEVCELKFMLFPSQIQKMSGLLILLAHQRDLLERFIQLQHTTRDMLHSFDWRAQLQYFFNKDSHTVQVSCIDAEFEYGFEYLGSSVREPITPQTERVFVSVTQAIKAHMGSLSLGSMESGKFEIVNELAQSLGHSFYSFNCNKPMNHLMLQDIFRGMAATGSWVCFNTLDHLSPAVLSVFAHLVGTVMDALRESKPSVRMQSEDVPLNPDGACFGLLDSSMSVTSRDPEKQLMYFSPMVNLPDCVLSQFRIVTVLQPEMALIVEVLLLSHGFVNGSEIGRKIMQLSDMTKTFLATSSQITDNVKMGGQSNCGVHGWSLQNMKQIISEAGDYLPLGDLECYDMTPIHSESPDKLLQREKEEFVLTETKVQMENIAIVVALRNCFMARMRNRDAVIFMNLLCELWPDVSIPLAFEPDMANGLPLTPAGDRIHARTPKSIESDKSLKDSLNLNITAQASLSQQMQGVHVGSSALRDALNLMHVAIVSATNELGLLPGTAFQSRVMQLLQLSMAHQTIFVVGPAGCGKSECIKTFAVAERERGKFITIQSIFTKAIESEQLMGYLHPETRQWKDGLLAYLLRKFCIQTDVTPDHMLNKPLIKILQMDGDVDVNQMELLQTIFQNQGTVVLGNNERLILPESARFIWEMENISQINPSLLASVGLLMMTTQDVGWKLMLTQWLEQRPETDKELLQSLCDIYLPSVIDYLAQCTRPPMFGSGPRTAMPQYKRVIPHSEENMISTFCTLLDTMLAAYNDLSDLEYERYFNLAAIWSFGGSLACEHRESFSNWWREQFESYIDYPEGASVFDYAVDSETHEFVQWVDILPTYTGTPHKGIPAEAFVHTVHNEQIAHLLGLLSDVGKPVMLIGENGCGKTSIVHERIRTVCSGEVAEVLALTIQANRFTNSQLLYERLNERLEWKHGKTYVPKGNKRLMCLIDDVNLGQVDKHGFQTSVEMVRQHIDDGGFYNPLTHSWRYVKNVTYVSTVNPSTTATVPKLSARFLRHFAIFGVPYPSANELHSIFSTLLHTHFVTPEMSAASSSSTSTGHYLGIHHEKVHHVVREEEEAVKEVLDLIVLVSLELQDRLRSMFLPTAHRCHYIFTIRDLTMIFKNLCLSLTIGCNKESVLLLWQHECQWVYGSRMVTDVDYRRFRQAFVNAVKKQFTDDEQIQLLIQPKQPMFSNLAEQDSGIVTAGRLNNHATDSNNDADNTMDMYKPIFKMELVSSLMDRGVDEYNKVHPRIKIALYKSVLEQVCRLARTIASPHEVGHTTLVSEGCAGRCSIIAQLAANLCGFSVLRIQPSQLTGHTGCEIDQFKTLLVSGYNRAGVKGDRVMLLVQEDDLQDEDYLIYLLEFIISGSISHLFSYEEQTTIINSIRTEVTQAGLTYTRDVAWDFFLRTVRNNFRICFVVGSGNKFQRRCREYPSFTKSVSFIWFPHWSKFQLVDHAYYHLKDVSWMSDIQRENIAHMLASMHTVLRQQDGRETTSGQYGHITNASYEKFVERFICLAEHRHTVIEDIQVVVNKTLKELSTENEMALKLKKQLEHEMVVLEERKAGTIQILSQIGQDTAITEQQIRVVKAQLFKISTLKKLLPEYQVAHERAVFKAIAIVADTKKVVQNVDVESLSELRAMGKPSIDIEDLLAAIIMILKSPSADLTWQKGAKRQMANLERFIEELMSFDDYQLPESTLALVEPYLKKASFDPDMMEKKTENAACASLCKWVRGVVRYHRMMLSKVKPLHKKVEETTQAVDDAEHKMATLENKRKSLEIRLSSLAKSFEEATIDKTDQDEKTRKMTKMLETAGQLRKLLKGERLRCQQIFDSHDRRLVAIPGGCSVGAAFVTYLAPYHHNFRRLMLTVHWPNCLRERGVPLVIDSIDGLRGRVIDWDIDGLKTASGASGLYDFDYTALVQMETYESPASKMRLSHVLHSDDNENEDDETEDNTGNKDGEGDEKQGDAPEDDKAEEETSDADATGDRSGDDVEDENPLPGEPPNIQDVPLERIQEEDGDEDETISMARSDATVPVITTAQYGQYVRSLIKLLIGEKTLTCWISKDFGLHQMENAAILLSSWQRPPLLIDPDSAGISWLARLSKTVNTQNLVVLNMENRNDSQLILSLEKCILRGKPVLLKNCLERLDNGISPLIHHRNTTHEDDKDEEPRMIHYCSRRILCHPDFRLYIATSLAKPSFSSEITSTTTMINYGQSHDTLTEDLLARGFAVIRPELYHEHRIALHNLQVERDTLYRLSVIVKEHARKQDSVKMLRSTRELNLIGQIRDTKLEMANRLKGTQLALQELENLREEFFPLARRGAVLYAILRSLSCVRREYQFTLEYFLELFHQAIGGQLPADFLDDNLDKVECEPEADDKVLSAQVHSSSNAANRENTAGGETEYKDDFQEDFVKGSDKHQPSLNGADSVDTSMAQQLLTATDSDNLPAINLPDTKQLPSDGVQYDNLSANHIKQYTDKLTSLIFKSVRNCLYENDCLLLTVLLCLNIQAEAGGSFSEEEMSLLLQGNPGLGMQLTLADFDCDLEPPMWLPEDKWDDMMAVSVLPGPLDSLCVHIAGDNKAWQQWYKSPHPEMEPLPLQIPSDTFMEQDQQPDTNEAEQPATSPDLGALSDFHQLLIIRMLRPDRLPFAMANYVNKHLQLNLLPADITGAVKSAGIDGTEQTDMDVILQDARRHLGVMVLLPLSAGQTNMRPQNYSRATGFRTLLVPQIQEIAQSKGVVLEHVQVGEGCDDHVIDSMDVAEKQDSWIIIENMHLASDALWEALKQKLVMIKNQRSSSPPSTPSKFSLWITTEPCDGIPLYILQNMHQVAWQHLIADKLSPSNQDTSKSESSALVTMHSLRTSLKDAMICALKQIPDDIWEQVRNESQNIKAAVYGLGIIQGALLSRQLFGPVGLTIWYPFNSVQITQAVNVILSQMLKTPPENVAKVDDICRVVSESIYGHICLSQSDKDYVNALVWHVLTNVMNNTSGILNLGGTTLPIPPANVEPSAYAHWLDEKLSTDDCTLEALSLHPNVEKEINETDAIQFMHHLDSMFEAQSIDGGSDIVTSKSAVSTVNIARLRSALDICAEQLPPLLEMGAVPDLPINQHEYSFPYHRPSLISLDTVSTSEMSDSITYVLQQECLWLNRILCHIRQQIHQIMHNILSGVEALHTLFLPTVYSLQEEQVPVSWLHPEQQPGTHSLLSWLRDLKRRYDQLQYWVRHGMVRTYKGNEEQVDLLLGGFGHVKRVWLGGLVNPHALLTALMQEKAHDLKCHIDQLTFKCHVLDTGDLDNMPAVATGGLTLTDMQLHGAEWDFENNCLCEASDSMCIFPALYVIPVPVSEVEAQQVNNPEYKTYHCPVFMNKSRQVQVTSFDLSSAVSPSHWTLASVAFILDTGLPEDGSRKSRSYLMLQKLAPGIAASDDLDDDQDDNEEEDVDEGEHENSESKMSMPQSDRSQMSYKALSPKAPPLPSDMSLVRERPMNMEVESKKSMEVPEDAVQAGLETDRQSETSSEKAASVSSRNNTANHVMQDDATVKPSQISAKESALSQFRQRQGSGSAGRRSLTGSRDSLVRPIPGDESMVERKRRQSKESVHVSESGVNGSVHGLDAGLERTTRDISASEQIRASRESVHSLNKHVPSTDNAGYNSQRHSQSSNLDKDDETESSSHKMRAKRPSQTSIKSDVSRHSDVKNQTAAMIGTERRQSSLANGASNDVNGELTNTQDFNQSNATRVEEQETIHDEMRFSDTNSLHGTDAHNLTSIQNKQPSVQSDGDLSQKDISQSVDQMEAINGEYTANGLAEKKRIDSPQEDDIFADIAPYNP